VKLQGARVLITGASRGLGYELASVVAARGARVVLVARSADLIEKLAGELNGEAFAADLCDPTCIDGLVAAIERDGPIDILVNNAGVDHTGRLTEADPSALAALYGVNLIAPVLLTRAVLPGMLERGRGNIVNISSIAGTNSVPGLAPYSSSKAGLSHFSGCLRLDLDRHPVEVTLAELGPIESTMMTSLRSYGPTKRALDRLAVLRLERDLKMDAVVAALIDAIERDRPHLRMPKRNAMFPMLVESPRRITRVLLRGVDTDTD
jgi:short-subunit dehydrogenase